MALRDLRGRGRRRRLRQPTGQLDARLLELGPPLLCGHLLHTARIDDAAIGAAVEDDVALPLCGGLELTERRARDGRGSRRAARWRCRWRSGWRERQKRR